jgi:hypothetical protein
MYDMSPSWASGPFLSENTLSPNGNSGSYPLIPARSSKVANGICPANARRHVLIQKEGQSSQMMLTSPGMFTRECFVSRHEALPRRVSVLALCSHGFRREYSNLILVSGALEQQISMTTLI